VAVPPTFLAVLLEQLLRPRTTHEHAALHAQQASHAQHVPQAPQVPGSQQRPSQGRFQRQRRHGLAHGGHLTVHIESVQNVQLAKGVLQGGALQAIEQDV